MTVQEKEEKVRKIVVDYCTPGIKKFENSQILPAVFEGLKDEARKQLIKGDMMGANYYMGAAKTFRKAALMLFMQHPEYNEIQVLETLAPSKEVKELCRFYSDFK